MFYLMAAAVPAEIQVIDPVASMVYRGMVDDILCSRWSSAFQKSKVLQMPSGFQSQLYVNAKNKFRSSRICPVAVPVPTKTIPQMRSIPQDNKKSGRYVPSSSSIWGGTFK